MERRAAHPVRAANHAHAAAVALVHLRREPRQPAGRPAVGDEHRPHRVGGRESDVHDDDLAAPLARQEVTAPRPTERDGEAGVNGTVRFTAREIEPRRSVDGEDGRPVGGQPVRERQHVSLGGTCRAGAEQRIYGNGGLRPGFFPPQLAHAVQTREGAIVDRVIGLRIDGRDPHGNPGGVERAGDHPAVPAVIPGARGDQDTAGRCLGQLGDEHLHGGSARRLHQYTARHAILGARRRIPRRRFARRQNRNRIHGITTPAYPTTRALSPETQPEWR